MVAILNEADPLAAVVVEVVVGCLVVGCLDVDADVDLELAIEAVV